MHYSTVERGIGIHFLDAIQPGRANTHLAPLNAAGVLFLIIKVMLSQSHDQSHNMWLPDWVLIIIILHVYI